MLINSAIGYSIEFAGENVAACEEEPLYFSSYSAFELVVGVGCGLLATLGMAVDAYICGDHESLGSNQNYFHDGWCRLWRKVIPSCATKILGEDHWHGSSGPLQCY